MKSRNSISAAEFTKVEGVKKAEKKKKKAQEKAAVPGLVKNFSSWTSSHGIPQIGGARNIFLRLIWVVLYLACVVIFSYQVYCIVSRYYAYETVVATEVKFEQRVFPAITICSVNPYKASKINTVPLLKQLIDDFVTSMPGNTIVDDTFGFNKEQNSVEKILLANTALVYIIKNVTNDIWEELTYQANDIILECRFGNEPCNISELIKIRDPVHGACYVFNHDSAYVSGRSGSHHGLKLLLKVDSAELLPIAETPAYRVTIHDQQNEPFPEAFGYNAGTGYVNSFAMQIHTLTRMSEPYGYCVANKNEVKDFDFKTSYTIEACLRSCYQKIAKETCGCADPRLGTHGENTYCPLDKMSCIEKLEDTIQQSTSCNCVHSCNDTIYTVTVSQSYWPQQKNLVGINGEEYDCSNTLQWNDANIQQCYDWWHKNTVRIEVYYDKLRYEHLKSNAAYELLDIVTDFGGQIGLWMGLSVISIVEMVVFMSALISFFLCMKKQKTLIPDERAIMEINMFNYMWKDSMVQRRENDRVKMEQKRSAASATSDRSESIVPQTPSMGKDNTFLLPDPEPNAVKKLSTRSKTLLF